MTWIIVWMFGTAASLVSISVIYGVSGGIAGWSYYQMLAIAALANMLIGIVSYTITPWNLVPIMRLGTFDQYLTKPYNPIVLILSRSGSKASIGGVISGSIMLVYALANISGINPIALASSLALFVLGTATLVMFAVMISLLSYVLFRSGNYIQWLMNIASDTANYPLQIYGLAGTVLLTVGLPVGLAAFYPAELMFVKIDYTFTVGIALLSALMLFGFYKLSMYLLRFYTSGGG